MATVRRWLAGGWELVGADLPLFAQAAFLVVLGSLLTGGLLLFPLWLGLLLMFAEKRAGRRPTLGQLTEGFAHFPAALGVWAVYLLASIPFVAASQGVMNWLHSAREWGRGAGWVGLAIQVVGHVVVSAPLFLALPLIADRGVGGCEALRTAWRRGRTILPLLFVSAVELTLLLLLGAFACGFGLLLTVPVAAGAQWLAYCELGAPLAGEEARRAETQGSESDAEDA